VQIGLQIQQWEALFEAYYQHTHEMISRVKDIPQQCHQGKGNAKPTWRPL
jgi:hypothetical protein